MDLQLKDQDDKWSVLRQIKDQLIMKHGLIMGDVDEHKPWGAYYRFTPDQKQKFLDLFFSNMYANELPGNISPKIMVFAPDQKVSLQYHERRDEIWTVLYGEVEAWFGSDNKAGKYTKYKKGDTFSYPALSRHKAGAANGGWAVVAEIWRHNNQDDLSTEADNIRLSDDYGRV